MNPEKGIHVPIEPTMTIGGKPATSDDYLPNSTRQTMEQRTDWGDLLNAPLPVPPQ